MSKISPKIRKTKSAEDYKNLGNGGGQEKQRMSEQNSQDEHGHSLSLPPPQASVFFFLEDKVSFFFPLFPAFSKHFCLSFMDLLATRAAIYMADIIPISPIMELKI